MRSYLTASTGKILGMLELLVMVVSLFYNKKHSNFFVTDQIQLETPYYPSMRLAVRLPSLAFHFSPARYHRLMHVIKIFEEGDGDSSEFLRPWNQADLEGWLSLLTWKVVISFIPFSLAIGCHPCSAIIWCTISHVSNKNVIGCGN